MIAQRKSGLWEGAGTVLFLSKIFGTTWIFQNFTGMLLLRSMMIIKSLEKTRNSCECET